MGILDQLHTRQSKWHTERAWRYARAFRSWHNNPATSASVTLPLCTKCSSKPLPFTLKTAQNEAYIAKVDLQFKYECPLSVVDDTTKATGNVGMIEVKHCTEFMFKIFLVNFRYHNLYSMPTTSSLVLGLVHLTEPPSACRECLG